MSESENSSAPRRRRDTKHVPIYSGIFSARVAIIAAAAVLFLPVAVFGIAEVVATPGRVHPGVTVGGVSVGGLAPTVAKARLNEELLKRAAQPVSITAEGESWTVKGSDLTIDFDGEELASRAMRVGRSGNTWTSLTQRVSAWFKPIELEAPAVVDQTQLSAFEDSIDAKVAVAPTDARVEIEGASVRVVPAVAGKGLLRSEFEKLLLPAFVATERVVRAPVGEVPAAISDDAAQSAARVAEAFISGPATVTFGAKSWSFAPAVVGGWIAFATTPTSGSASALQAVIASAPLEASVLPRVGVAGEPPVDAQFKTRNGKVTIIPSRPGTGPDFDALATELTAVLAEKDGQRAAELKIASKEPELTTEEAKAMGVRERISTYTTTYVASNRPRVNNIHLLGDALDGKLVPPGGTFSFNGAVGERTAAKGYKEANAIVNGKLVPQLGGGICQVGTTLFNTIFLSGLPVVERHNHSFYISHYPKGRDATVSWGGPDLKWKNDTGNWVLLSVSYTSSSITIALYGTDPGYDVSSETSAWSNERPFPTEEVKDPTLLTGVRVVEDGGVTGRTCTVTRTVRKDGAVIRTDEFVSKYRPKIEIVRVGTKPKPSTPATTP